MRRILPSGVIFVVKAYRFVHPELAFMSTQVAPSSVDLQVSFIFPEPPMSTILPSGIDRLLRSDLADHPELAFTSVQVLPLSMDFQVSFWKAPPCSRPPIRIMPEVALMLWPDRADHPELAFMSVHVAP
jgi:hypothetical protein